MKTRLLSFGLLLLFVAACTTKDPEPEPTGLCRLAEVKMDGPHPWGNWQIPFYDDQNRVVGIKLPTLDGHYPDPHDLISITYDSEGRRSELLLTTKGAVDFYRTVYAYDANGELETVYNHYENSATGTKGVYLRFDLSYSNGKLATIRRTFIDKGQELEQEMAEYTFSGDQLIKIVSYYLNDEPVERRYVEHFTYDNQKRPDYLGLMPTGYRFYLHDFLLPTGPNNITSYVQEEHSSRGVHQSHSYQNTYTYNSQGYPVQQVQKTSDGKEQRFSYTYACE